LCLGDLVRERRTTGAQADLLVREEVCLQRTAIPTPSVLVVSVELLPR
jgi:hypothetical protein